MKQLIEMQLVSIPRDQFNEEEWRQQFEGIEEVYPQVASAEEFLANRADMSYFNPQMQLEDGVLPDIIHLLVPIWA